MARRVAVIGAGVVGLACASELARRGHALTLIDPGPPGEYCSFGNAGALSRASFVPQGLPGMWKKVPGWLADPAGPLCIRLRYLPRIVPWLWRYQRSTSLEQVNRIADALYGLLDCAIDAWRPLAAWAGVPELIRQDGYAFVYESEAAFRGDALGRELRRARGVKIEVLAGPEIREFDPALSPRLTHLVLLPEQGHVPNPLRLSQALASRLAAGGAQLLRQKALAFEHRGDGRVASVVTDRGKVDADAVVIAAGAHSGELASQLGSRVPIETERGYHVMLEAPSLVPRIPFMSGEGKFFATPMENGLRIAGTVELAGLAAPPNYARADVLLAGGKRLIPGMTFGKVERWMGHRPSLPDSKPVIGRAHSANAYFAFGHGHVGLTAAASTAEIIADLVEGKPPSIDIAPFAADRF